jgi:hypothetical protein
MNISTSTLDTPMDTETVLTYFVNTLLHKVLQFDKPFLDCPSGLLRIDDPFEFNDLPFTRLHVCNFEVLRECESGDSLEAFLEMRLDAERGNQYYYYLSKFKRA